MGSVPVQYVLCLGVFILRGICSGVSVLDGSVLGEVSTEGCLHWGSLYSENLY